MTVSFEETGRVYMLGKRISDETMAGSKAKVALRLAEYSLMEDCALH